MTVNLWRFRHYRFVLTASIVVAFLSCSPVGLAVLAYLLINSTKRAFQAEGTSVLRPIVVGVCLGISLYIVVWLPVFLAQKNDQALVSTLSSQIANEVAALVDRELSKLPDNHPVKVRFGLFQGVDNPKMFFYNGGEGVGQTLQPESFQARIRFSKGTVPLKVCFLSAKRFRNVEVLRGILSTHSQGVSDGRVEFSIGPSIGEEWCASKDEIVMSIHDH